MLSSTRNSIKKLRNLIRISSYAVIFLLTGALAAPPLLNHLFNLERIKPEIEKSLSAFFQRSLAAERLEWASFPRPSLTAINVTARDIDGSALVTAPKILIRPKISRLLRGELFLKSLDIVNARFFLRRYPSGTFNFAQTYKDMQKRQSAQGTEEKDSFVAVVINKINFVHGQIFVFDQTLNPPQLHLNVTGNAKIHISQTTDPWTLTLDAVVHHRTSRGTLKLEGAFGEETTMELSVRHIPISSLGDYFPPLDHLDGRIHAEGTINHRNGELSWDINGGTDKLKPAFIDDFPIDLQGRFRSRTGLPLDAMFKVGAAKTDGAVQFQVLRLAPPTYRLTPHFETIDVNDLSALSHFFPETATASAIHQSTSPYDVGGSNSSFAPPNITLQTLTGILQGTGDEWLGNGSFLAGSAGGHAIKNGTFTLRRSKPAMVLENMEFQTEEGFMISSATWIPGGIGTEPGPGLTVNWRAEDVDFTMAQSLLGVDLQTTGRMFTTGNLSGRWPQFVSRDLNGTLQIQIKDGQISRVHGALKFLSTFNLKSIFRDSGGRRTLPFNVINGTFNVRNGIAASVTPFKVESGTMDAAFAGEIDLVQQAIQADAIVQFLNPLDETIGLIPGMESILLGGEKTFLPIYAKLSGKLSDPEVKIESIKSVGKKAWNTFKGVLKLPLSIFDTISGRPSN